jgi:hypothetical protein
MSKITFHYSLQRALRVMRAVNKDFAFAFNVTARAWDNGREQGLSFNVFNHLGNVQGAVFVAEARSSDELLVVVDENASVFQQQPSEDGWKTGRVYFPVSKEKAAVVHIRKFLMAFAAGEEPDIPAACTAAGRTA